MRRGAKPGKAKVVAKQPRPRTSPKDEASKRHDLEKRLAESLAQQAATAEILRVISDSPTDLQPVLHAVAESAARLCEAQDATIWLRDGDRLLPRAHFGPIPHSALVPIVRGSVGGRAVIEGRTFHIHDLMAVENEDEFPVARAFALQDKFRTTLATPLLRQGVALGVILIRRGEVRPFSEAHISLLQTFADQAVIAVENVRLFNELEGKNVALTAAHAQVTEALEQQTATAEILRVISSSPTDVQPVFDAIVESAVRLCDARYGAVFNFDGDLVHLMAHHNFSETALEGFREQYPMRPTRAHISGRAILSGSVVQIPDVALDPEYGSPHTVPQGFRSLLAVPILRGGAPIGAIVIYRPESGMLSDEQISLLQTFAAQAVIAIENVRLFKELEARNRDLTATSEILRVISSSPTDVQPVFDAVAVSAAALCGAVDALIMLVDGGTMRRVAHFGAITSVSDGRPVTSATPTGRAIVERRVIHNHDILEEFARGDYLEARRLQEATGFRTVLAVPLIREENVIGVITIRRLEVRPFTEEQIALVKTFADQAVIAIENVRLFNELQASNRELTTALDQQTATSDILRVISRSQTDVQPVFDAILGSAVRLLRGYSGTLTRLVGDQIELVALTSTDDSGDAALRAAYPQPLQSEGTAAQAMRDRATLNIADAHTDPRVSEAQRAYVRVRDYRSWAVVPLLRPDEAVGTISVTRRDPGGFTDDEIALLKTFADQAVIAIENVRLFTELQEKNQALTEAHAQISEALEQQTATSEILRVIASSPTDLQPVLDALAESASRLCRSVDCNIFLPAGDRLVLRARYGPSRGEADVVGQFVLALVRGTVAGRTVLERRTVHVIDLLAEADEFPEAHQNARRFGFRTMLSVPLIRESAALGVIQLLRTEVNPFTDRQAELLKTFADQAVIAIENVRLFTELQASNRDLTSALDTQTATSDILRVISQSQTDVQPVFDAILSSAVRLLRGYSGAVTRLVGDQITLAAATSSDDAGDASLRRIYPQSLQSETANAQAIRDRAPLNIADAQADPRLPDASHAAARARGFRSLVTVPLLGHDEAVGTISVMRRDPGGFSDDEIALLKTFADQAVIAIENARLLSELQQKNDALTQAHAQVSEALEQQTATAEILRVISTSPTDLQPVLDTVVTSAARFCGAYDAILFRRESGSLQMAAHHGPIPVRVGGGLRLIRGTVGGRAFLERRAVHVADLLNEAEEFPEGNADARGSGHRSILSVPLLREGAAIGVITLRRTEVDPFTDKQVALLQTFADQAVIAIENVRLFKELEARNRDLTEALEQQTATSEILRVISQSQTDVQPVFDTIVRSAVRLCDALFSALFQFDGELIHLVAQHNYAPEALEEVRHIYPARPTRALLTGRAILERALVHVPDIELDPEWPHQALTRAVGFRSGLWVPMLREGVPIGVIAVARADPGPFSDSAIELLKTFADQAVIAVENVRLFKELQARTGELTQSVEQLTALGEVSRAVSSTLDVETVLDTIVSRASQLAGGAGCSIYEYDEAGERFELRAMHNYDAAFVEALRAAHLRKGEGLMGRAAELREPIQIPDITQPGAYQSSVRDALIRFGYRALLSVPLLREDQIIGSLSFNRKAPGEFPPEVVDVLKTFATQSALAIQNARLFREIADKSAQLETASRHKSEFLANMSHELRTPLNAIIGFSEILAEKMFGDVNEKQTEYLQDILESGRHLLSLINDILDLSKIEAGRMELEVTEFDLPTAIENALILVRERASRHGIRLGSTIDERLGTIVGDERKVKQVLLNLLSNALKFTPEGGRIDVSAGVNNGVAEIAVADTGVGIAPEDQGAVFEEFRQVGTADKKVEGTGLGLALSRKFIELHGGRIWVESQVGHGSTFTFTLPVRREE